MNIDRIIIQWLAPALIHGLVDYLTRRFVAWLFGDAR